MAPMDSKISTNPERIVLKTIGISFIVSSLVLIPQSIRNALLVDESVEFIRQTAVNNFIANCTRDPKSCEFLVKVIKR